MVVIIFFAADKISENYAYSCGLCGPRVHLEQEFTKHELKLS